MSKERSHDGDVDFIRALAELLRENDLTELEVVREYGDNPVGASGGLSTGWSPSSPTFGEPALRW